jgi:tRNA:m4X modification enzyme
MIRSGIISPGFVGFETFFGAGMQLPAPDESKHAATVGSARPGRCRYFLKHKNRSCTALVRQDSEYCPVHDPAAQRVPCPYGPHTVRAADLAGHLHVCPGFANRPEAHPAFVVGCNKVTAAPWPSAAVEDVEVGQIPSEFASASNTLFTSQHTLNAAQVSEAVTRLELFAAAGELGSAKHAQQRLAIVRHIDAFFSPSGVGLDVTDGSVGFVEFGAGKAGLALAISVAYPGAPIVVVDRQGFRDCKDKTIVRAPQKSARAEGQTEASAPTEGTASSGLVDDEAVPVAASEPAVVVRVKMDVGDFSFRRFLHEGVTWYPADTARALQRVTRWVAVGKHLCGGCTDMSLRSVASHSTPSSGNNVVEVSDAASSPTMTAGFVGLAIATCCHHLCTADTFFDGSVEPGLAGFAKSVASWATAGSDAPADKVSVGAAAKDWLDAKRCDKLRAVFPHVDCVRYIAATVTPENRLLLARL